MIWYQFNDFRSDFYNKRAQEGFSAEDLDRMPVPEFIDFVRQWARAQREKEPQAR